MPANRPVSDQMAECGRTSPLTFTGDGTPQDWVYIADEGITLCPLHRKRLPEVWQDVIRIYKKGELDELAGDPKPPPPAGASATSSRRDDRHKEGGDHE